MGSTVRLSTLMMTRRRLSSRRGTSSSLLDTVSTDAVSDTSLSISVRGMTGTGTPGLLSSAMVWPRLLASTMESRRSSSESVSAKATNLVELDTTECSRCVVRGARWNRIRRFPDSCCAHTQIAGDRLASFRVESAASIRLDIMSERLTPRAKSGETHVNVLAFFWRLASDSQIPSLGLETRQLGPQSRDHFRRNLHLLNCGMRIELSRHADLWLARRLRVGLGPQNLQIPQTFRQIVLLENHAFLSWALQSASSPARLQTRIETFANWAETGLTACLFQSNLEWCCIKGCPRPTTAAPL